MQGGTPVGRRLFVACVASLMHWGVPAVLADEVSLHQMDWFGGVTGAPLIANSDWGVAVFDIAPGTSTQYLNVVGIDEMGAGQWLAQNVPVLSLDADPIGGARAAYVDLGRMGVERGEAAAGREYYYTVGGFAETMPASGTIGTVSPQNRRVDYAYDFLNFGADFNTPTFPTGYSAVSSPVMQDMGPPPAPALPQTPPSKPPAKQVLRRNMPSVEQGRNACVPGSAANSIYWLHEQKGMDIGGRTLNQLYSDLHDMVETDPNRGTTVDNFFDAKREFMRGRGIVKESRGQVTWDWIWDEVNDNEAVELSYAWWGYVNGEWQYVGHTVTVMGKYDDGWNRKLLVRDDAHQGEDGTGEPRWTRVGEFFPGWLSLLDEAAYTYVYYAASQSIPEPGTVSLLALGGWLLLRRRRR